MNLILTGSYELKQIANAWRKKCGVEFIPLQSLMAQIKFSQSTSLRADVMVARAALDFEFTEESVEPLENSLDGIIRLVGELRKLAPMHAMIDGRKWSAIPFVLVLADGLFDAPIPHALEISILIENRPPLDILTQVEQIFHEYRDKLLDELDNLGLLVTYHRGRYRVGPALKPHEKNREGYLYYGPADQRSGRSRFYTVDRDIFGIEYEVELFEALINNPKVSERELQRFFVENPHFWSLPGLCKRFLT